MTVRAPARQRQRAWLGRTPPLSPEGEQRLKDVDAFADNMQRRWWTIGAGALLLFAGHLLGATPAGYGTLSAVAIVALGLNGVAGLALTRGAYHRWHVYGLALFDLALAALLVVFFGAGGFAVALVLAAVPYVSDPGDRWWPVLAGGAGVAYVLAVAVHGSAYPPGGIGWTVVLEGAAVAAVIGAIRRVPAALLGRIHDTRAVIAQTQQGYLAVRASAQRSDELGLLQQAINGVLDDIAQTISGVQREADEVAAFADVLATASEEMLGASRRVAGAAAELAGGMTEQRALAQAGEQEGTDAAKEAGDLRARAERTEADAHQLVESAARGRRSVERASGTLLAIGREVRSTAATVQELKGHSERIGTINRAIAKIARQTHLLALNAAIEAARAEEHGEGFGAVAEQIRTLAREAGSAARDVTELVAAVRAGIENVATAMTAGAEQVQGVGEVADEARGALEELHGAAEQAADLVTATADVSRAQSERMTALTDKMSRVAGISDRSSRQANDAAESMRRQIDAMESLHQTGRQLAAIAERLRTNIARFSVLRPEQTTTEHRVVSRPPA